MFETVTAVLDWFGLCVFAVTGALVASRKEMDVVGFVLLAVVTGVGGGTVRDLVLGLAPVFWVETPAYLLVCAGVGAAVFFLAHIPNSRYRVLLWFDAVGLALFAVTGAERALDAGAPGSVAVAMGVATASFGGILRDLLGGEEPVILRREIYVTAALAGALTLALADSAGVVREVALMAGFAVALALRAAGIWWGLSLPRYRARPGREVSEIEGESGEEG
ncbi:trimeric intracellular cation channel family protein [Oceanicola sp. 502str15]|uniref:trimeric intracellular cation channel family protein n=1 Tax=Oceanicola sp. 502str15 TaxID=2696061 RepID=UPI002095ADC7|nr:trimeric intracellular cation channel family protein [Oceanicola sp. 502str15]MCO6383081.1 trimeric intracellular cation channel family protein [Oceanicola sp. 502str15]